MTTARTIKTKGAASAATDPRHAHPNPCEDQEMNAHATITPPASPAIVPVPFPGETAFNQADGAMSLLRSAMKLAGSGGPINAEEKMDVLVLLEHAYAMLEPVRLFLDEVEFEHGNQQRFLDCRRAWVLSRQGGPA